MRWGGDFHSKVDEMHFEIIVPRGIALEAVDQLGKGRNATVSVLPEHKPGSCPLEVRNPQMTGDDVEFVQRFIGEREAGEPDGDFGPDTRDGVRWYQGMRGIDVTGVVDRKTWRNMRIEPTFWTRARRTTGPPGPITACG